MSDARSTPPLGEGAVVGGRYVVRGVLGEGGTGVVYEATHQEDGKVVALKVIHPELAGDEQIRGRFAREVAILKRLRGKHLLGIVDSGEADDPLRPGARMVYLALPKIDGPSLDELLDAEAPLDEARVVEIARGVCNGLAEAHAQGVVHRDLKAANVLLRGGKHAVVVDFGLAKIVTGGGGTGTTALTQHNMLFGTPEYMAPEQARGDELDARCDVYAVGVLLYRMLTGAVPFSRATPLATLTAQMTETPEPPRVRAPDAAISPAMEAVVLHALAKSPFDRYPTATALADALGSALAKPHDLDAVRPHTIVPVEEEAEGHSPTIPSPLPPPRLTPTVPPVERPRSRRRGKTTTVLLWIVFGVVGIAVGVYLSLRSG